MLSVSAFNALLKTLEEPPEHVVFILATTELQKLPATVVSRCQRFDFRRISTDALMKRLAYIASQEHLELDAEAARMLAKLAQGGMRDAISLLELCAGGSRSITPETVNESVGTAGRDSMADTVRAVVEQNYDALFAQIEEVVQSSKDLLVFWQDLISFYRDLLVVKTTSNAAAYLDLTDSESEQIRDIAGKFRRETLLYHCKLLEDALLSMQKSNAVKRVVAELTLVQMCDEALNQTNEALLSRVAKLEDAVLLGGLSRGSVASPAPENLSPADKPAAVPTPVAEPNAASDSPKRILRPFRNWMEAVERLSQSDVMLASFCRSANCYTAENGTVIVRFATEFAMQMAQKNGGKEKLRAAISAALKKELADAELLMEVCKEQNKSAMDEIIEAVEE